MRLVRFGSYVLAFLLIVGASAHGAEDDDEQASSAPVVEKEVPLPAYPAAESLIAFDAGAAAANRYLLDQTSISVGEDAVVRFVLVVRSPSGVDNVSFEGIRCHSMERRLYATGRSDRTWSRSRNTKWMPISNSRLSLPHQALARQYLCDRGVPIRSPKEGIDAIRRGVQPVWPGA